MSDAPSRPASVIVNAPSTENAAFIFVQTDEWLDDATAAKIIAEWSRWVESGVSL